MWSKELFPKYIMFYFTQIQAHPYLFLLDCPSSHSPAPHIDSMILYSIRILKPVQAESRFKLLSKYFIDKTELLNPLLWTTMLKKKTLIICKPQFSYLQEKDDRLLTPWVFLGLDNVCSIYINVDFGILCYSSCHITERSMNIPWVRAFPQH